MNPVDLSPVARAASTADLFLAVRAATGWLNATNGTGPAEQTMRVLKVAEETGEVAAAWIGATGQNPRKGITHTTADVAAELADVAFTALVAIASIGHDPHTVMTTVAAKVLGRIHRPCELCGAADTTTDACTTADGLVWLCNDMRTCDGRRAVRYGKATA
jgi:NTP pyrophosphatase (non-canonical NTP hydrolase)